MVLIS